MLIDINLPGPDGYEMARGLRGQRWGKGRILIDLTTSGEKIGERRFSEAGFDHHLTKPVNFEVLLKRIGRPQTS